MTLPKKQKAAPKKTTVKKPLPAADHSSKSPYSKQNIKRFFYGDGEENLKFNL